MDRKSRARHLAREANPALSLEERAEILGLVNIDVAEALKLFDDMKPDEVAGAVKGFLEDRKAAPPRSTPGTPPPPYRLQPAGQIVRNLGQIAPELVPNRDALGKGPCGALYKVSYKDRDEDFWIDVDGHALDRVNTWLDTREWQQKHRKTGTIMEPLFINGMIKSGKTKFLKDILPAVVRQHSYFGEGGEQEVVVWHLSLDKLPYKQGAVAMLRAMLELLLEWASQLRLPVPEHVLQKAFVTLKGMDFPGDYMGAIESVLDNLGTPALILWDEVHVLFQPLAAPDGTVDVRLADDIRRFLKVLIVHVKAPILWCMTGSSMASFWANIALSPKHGVSLLKSHLKLDLPDVASDQVMLLCWEMLVERYALKQRFDVDALRNAELLPELSGQTPAMLCYLMEMWSAEDFPRDITSFVLGHIKDKLLIELIEDLQPYLSLMAAAERIELYNLADPLLGVNLGPTKSRGLANMMSGFTQPVRPGSSRVCLKNSYYAELFKLILTPDGQLVYLWRGDPQIANLYTLQAMRMITHFGDTLSEWRKYRSQKKAFPGSGVLDAGVQMFAHMLVKRYGGANWTQEYFFQQVYLSRHNSRTRDRLQGKLDKKTTAEKVELYFIMLRNCVCHEDFGLEPMTQPAASVSYSADDEMRAVEAWPLGSSGSGRVAAVISLVELLRPIQVAWQDEQPQSVGQPAGTVQPAAAHVSVGGTISGSSSGSDISALQTLPQSFAARGGRLDLPNLRPIRVLVGRPVPGRPLLPPPPHAFAGPGLHNATKRCRHVYCPVRSMNWT